MTGELVWALAGASWAGWYVQHCWRYPLIACGRCQGRGREVSHATGNPTSRLCPKCEGRAWRARRLSRWMGRAS